MNIYKNQIEAQQAANNFFLEVFGYTNGAKLESKTIVDGFEILKFYSCDDSGMDDTFSCKIEAEETTWYSI